MFLNQYNDARCRIDWNGRIMDYLYSYVVDAHRRFPPRVAAHRVLSSTERVVHVEHNIIGFWTTKTNIVFRKGWRKPMVSLLPRRMLDGRGHASDGIRTYYTTPYAVQAIIDSDPRLSTMVGPTTKRRGK